MTSRAGQTKGKGTESEIHKCRDESNWKKLLELADQLRQRSGSGQNSVHFANLLIGEAKLEMFLEDYPPVEQHISKARTSLTDAKRYLAECTKSDAAKSNVATDARFLLAKCCYAQGQYEQALEHLDQGGIERLEERPLGARMLKILAESFAIKGLCLEQQTKGPAVDKESIVKYYFQAGEMGLKYLQVVEKSQGIQGAQVQVGGAVTTEFRIGILLETALQRAPILMMKTGQIRDAVEQYRSVMRAQETTSTQSLRMTLARQLAEVLLRGVCEHEWQQIQPQQEQKRTSKYWRPQVYSGGSLYVPGEHIEEILLLLSISDAIAVRNVVLDRSPDVAQDRTQSIKNVTSVLDLLSIALARNAQFGLLCENFEKVAKFSCEEYHIWNQFGLSLIAAGSYFRGVRMLLESAELRPKYGFDLLLAAKVTLVNLNDAAEALRLVEQAIKRETIFQESDILAVCYTLKGLCHEVLADSTICKKQKQEHRMHAFKALIKAKQIDPDYPQTEYLLGLHYANVHQIDAAMVCAKRVLNLAPDYFPGVQLLIILLTAQKKHEEALQLTQFTLEEYPNNLNLLYLKVYLEDYLYGPEKALHTAGAMLLQWKVLFEEKLKASQAIANGLTSQSIGPSSLGIVPIPNAPSGRASVLESPWVEREGTIMSRLDHSLTETLSRLTPGTRRPNVDENLIQQMQMHIWLLTAKLYIKLEHFHEAERSIVEAANAVQYSPHVQLTRGLLHEARGEYVEAKTLFEGALAVQPNNVVALQHLAMVYHQLGSHQLAEATLQSAALIEPMSPTTWFYLGKVLQESGTPLEASECFETAVQLELYAPLLDFSELPKTL